MPFADHRAEDHQSNLWRMDLSAARRTRAARVHGELTPCRSALLATSAVEVKVAPGRLTARSTPVPHGFSGFGADAQRAYGVVALWSPRTVA
jgi:hypothetical protein